MPTYPASIENMCQGVQIAGVPSNKENYMIYSWSMILNYLVWNSKLAMDSELNALMDPEPTLDLQTDVK
jgi:hypothetical protein